MLFIEVIYGAQFAADIVTELGGITAPLLTCEYNEYPDAENLPSGCSTCSLTCNNIAGTCQANVSRCTVCQNSLCTACTESGAGKCTACITGAFDVGADGNCVCSDGYYDVGNTNDNCLACPPSKCATCTDGETHYCQSCTGAYFLQPDAIDV
jgi:hypothetical protein